MPFPTGVPKLNSVRFGHAAHRLEQRDDSASHCDGDDGNPTSTIDLSAGFGSGVHDDEPENHDDDLRRLRRRNCNGVNTDYGKIRMWIGDGNATLHNHYATPWSSGYTGDSAGDIPQGLPFGGRPAGGFQRDKIFGSSTYGSGYGSVYGDDGHGVDGRGLPFLFWPVTWGPSPGDWSPAYLHSDEYGNVTNTTRPGGPLYTFTLQSQSDNTTIRILADNATAISLIPNIAGNCSNVLNQDTTYGTKRVKFVPYQDNMPVPEQAIQYFRANSIAMTLDGYNNTMASNETSPAGEHTPFPGWANQDLIGCVNKTIGEAALLITTNDDSQTLPPKKLSIFEESRLSEEDAYYSAAGRTADIPAFILVLIPLMLVLRQLIWASRD